MAAHQCSSPWNGRVLERNGRKRELSMDGDDPGGARVKVRLELEKCHEYHRWRWLTCFEKSRTASPASRYAEDAALRRPVSLNQDASIVFTGPRGNGKSSLAIIAGLLLRRPVIDADDRFISKIGISSAAFKRNYGAEKYLNEQLETTKALLTQYEKGCVIACGSCIMADKCRAFMAEFRKTHPVIYVSRPAEDIADYLGLREKGKMQQWLDSIHSRFLTISNFEFFNLPETWKETGERCPAEEYLQSVLHHRLMRQKKVQALQKTQAAVARFLTAALGHRATSLSYTVFPTVYPTLPEHRVYSNAVCVSLESLASGEVDISRIYPAADAVEIILDCNTRCKTIVASGLASRFIAEIRHFHAVPVIYHVRMDDVQPVDWKLYTYLLYQGLRSAPDYLTVDLDAADSEIQTLCAESGRTKVIAHQDIKTGDVHYWQSDEPLRLYRRALDLGCHLVRLVKQCETMAENFSCMDLVSKIHTSDGSSIIAYNTGSLGRLSLVCNPVLTPVLHAPKDHPQLNPTPTDMTMNERWNTLFTLQALDPLRFYVVGSSVKDSLSPAMHNAAFQALSMPHNYSIHETNALEDLTALFTDPKFGGASVSLPFKTGILSMAKTLSPAARLIGSSNTILPLRSLPDLPEKSDPREKRQRHRAGPVEMLYADNTDWMGICACVSRSISPANSVNPETAGLVIGAGGIARAAVYCLMRLGVRNICIYNRTVSHARSLAMHFEQVFEDFLRENENENENEGQYSRNSNNNSERLRITVLDSIDSPWPENFNQPSIAICAIKAYDHQNPTAPPLKIPQAWMKNPTGGIVVEVRAQTYIIPFQQLILISLHTTHQKHR